MSQPYVEVEPSMGSVVLMCGWLHAKIKGSNMAVVFNHKEYFATVLMHGCLLAEIIGTSLFATTGF